MIEPNCFAIHVTYTCPLTCAHCCFSSGPSVKEKLDFNHIIDSIDALDTEQIDFVIFTGGDAFLLGNKLVELVAHTNTRGFKTRIVTSAYWANTNEATHNRLKALKDVGLDEMTISWDDFHAEQNSFNIDFQYTYRAFWEARKLGIFSTVSVVRTQNSYWTSERVKEELGFASDTNEFIFDIPINFTGRAESDLPNSLPAEDKMLGPCAFVLAGPTLSAKNKLMACCGIIPETNHLVIEDNFIPSKLPTYLEKAKQSPLYNWLYTKGPLAIAEYIEEKYDTPIPNKGLIGGNCEACKVLFETPELVSHLDDALETQKTQIFDEVSALKVLGLLEPSESWKIFDLWKK